jgi:cation-transporting P-type ATPase 13A2
MTQPFFILQYLVSAVYILESVTIFAIFMIFFGFLTTSINYVLLYYSYQQIKQSAEKHFQVTVIRGGEVKTVDKVDLVCGDIYVPNHEIPCDSILMEGEVFIDESSLTGESFPVPKFKLSNDIEIEQNNHWVFEGSMVKTKKEGTLAMVINIGFGSRRGRIIRKILTKKPKQP